MRHRFARSVGVAAMWAAVLGRPGPACAQQPAPPTAPQAPASMRIDAAIAMALSNYPALRAADAEVEAARAGTALARSAYLPTTDLLWQANGATRNNVTGLLLPQSIVPSITGPVDPVSYAGVWGSAAGALFSWTPIDFGLRRANVGVADRLVTEATASADVTRLQVGVRAADAFLGALAADEVVRAAQANVDRLQVFATSVATLVRNQLRPGADGSRADAEVAAARVQVLRAQLAATSARATLAEAIGLGGQTVTPDPATLLEHLPGEGPTPPAPPSLSSPSGPDAHPLARADLAAIATSQSRSAALARAYAPRVTFEAALFARSDVAAGVSGGGAAGLWPTTSNWAAGLNVTFSVFDLAGVRARRQAEAGHERADRARYDQTMQALRAEDARATAALDVARQILAAIPAELEAARDAESRARARYDAGLAPLTEVADAAHLLAQAETDDALSRLGLWQALLADANAHGSLAPFLDQVK